MPGPPAELVGLHGGVDSFDGALPVTWEVSTMANRNVSQVRWGCPARGRTTPSLPLLAAAIRVKQ
ncbi:MAG: hypothetical protein AMXMBFR64_56550 [Myxococcales bacterium]